MMRRVAGIVVLSLAIAAPAAAKQTTRVTFPFHDDELLLPAQHDGGLALLPPDASPGVPLPVVVFLHGNNLEKRTHLWFGTPSQPDLGPLAAHAMDSGRVAPFVLAAPSQTRNADAGRSLWPDFDLDEFVAALDQGVRGKATLDMGAIYVVGHSGAGCNAAGGLQRIAREHGSVVPRAIVLLDTCLDDEAGASFGVAPPSTLVWVRWQRRWPRPLQAFQASFEESALEAGASPLLRVDQVRGLRGDPHERLVVDGMNVTLATLLPPPQGRGGATPSAE